MKRVLLFFTACLLLAAESSAFCGFFVAKANTKLFNKSSQVILVRDGNRTTITMSNDYQGEAKDFAMVVPVPHVLKENQIRTVDQIIFQRFDDYSAPRLAEYYDDNPCQLYVVEEFAMAMAAPTTTDSAFDIADDEYNVTIEAKYDIGEYDILILSAKESDGLKRWLEDNDYKIPEGAEEVLDPYITSGMKFFVAKVDLEVLDASGSNLLSPLQMEMESEKFMLPIRLGMANSQGSQDLIVYAFTKTGRVECTNYRTVELPTGNEVPTFIKDPTLFGYFYADVFKTAYRRQAKKAVFLEYAWNISGNQWQKCDPCVSDPPIFSDLQHGGVDWISSGGNAYQGDLFFTRLHVRYDRSRFPQDLQFQETPNRQHFQCRYVIRHPATGDFDCDNAEDYLETVAVRRQKEMKELVNLTRWDVSRWKDYLQEYNEHLPDDDQGYLHGGKDHLYDDAGLGVQSNARSWLWILLAASLLLFTIEIRRRVQRSRSVRQKVKSE